MKKIAKIFGAIAAIGAAVAGGVALYKKFISPNEDFEDPDDELDEEFEDEDLDMDTAKTTDRRLRIPDTGRGTEGRGTR